MPTDKRTYMLTVIARDDADLSDTIDVTIQLLEVTTTENQENQAPEFVDGDSVPFDVRENTKGFIGRVRATDANGDTLTYSITSGNTDDIFRVDQTGRLYNTESLDSEPPGAAPSITVEVSDGRVTDRIIVNITVINVNEPPVFGTLETPITFDIYSVEENADMGTLLGAPVPTADPESNPVTYSLSGTDAASFTIDAANDNIASPPKVAGQLRTLAELDYETKSIYHVTVSATDGNTPPVKIPVTILVTDEDDARCSPPVLKSHATCQRTSRWTQTSVCPSPLLIKTTMPY